MTRLKKLIQRADAVYGIEAVVILGLMIVIPVFFDYHFAMNDDVYINAIVSGRYSGTPDIHNIQMIAPLNGFFNLLYSLNARVPWFGFFMLLCQFVSLYRITVCLAGRLNAGKAASVFWLTALNLLFAGIMVNEIVVVQYTYTAGLLMASATIGLFCMDSDEFRSRKGVLRYAGILFQYLLAFCIRTEIFLFLIPFSLLITVIHYYRNAGFRPVKKELVLWGTVWGSLILGILILYGADGICYTGEGWKEYRNVFSSRTQLYDFVGLPDYEENSDFYRSAGISRSQYDLLDNYNFSLDENITSRTLESVVEYADRERTSGYKGVEKLYMGMFTLPLREGIWSYTHRIMFDPALSREDVPWNIVCAVLYLVFILLTFFSGRWMNLLFVSGMFGIRSVLWMYIILKQRTPARVTHALFVIEMVCLLLFAAEEVSCICKKKKGCLTQWKKRLLGAGGALLLAGICILAVRTWGRFCGNYREIVSGNEEWYQLQEYCLKNSESFYFFDVYSMVNYSEKMFYRHSGEMDNYDLCGGWQAKSPLAAEKYQRFGISSVEKGLTENDNVFFVIAHGEDMDWLFRLYEEKGVRLEARLQEQVAGRFDVYSLEAR